MLRHILFLALVLCGGIGISLAQDLPDPPCLLTDEPLAGVLDPIIHRVYPTNAPVFDNVFEIWMTNDVDARWSQSDVDWFALSIMDNDSTDTSNDLFAMVWDYFCIAGIGDLNPEP
jgi:hypothetical protein